ncbi:MAG: c-type cytochrome [Sphingomonadales bacterium]|nr:c-type cytochrome [Sphingomonadales bacterium]
MMTRFDLFLASGALLLLAPDGAQAAPDLGAQIVTQGAPSGTPPCAACHGPQLHGVAALKTPAIAGLSADYILARLAHYASPEGHNAQMKQVGMSLTPAEKQAVAAYVATMKR